MVKATSIVIWSNGASYELIDDHDQDCCEDVYADWDHMSYAGIVKVRAVSKLLTNPLLSVKLYLPAKSSESFGAVAVTCIFPTM